MAGYKAAEPNILPDGPFGWSLYLLPAGRSIQEGGQVATASPVPEPQLFRPVPRALAEDRWLGLSQDRVNPDAPSDLSNRLGAILGELAGAMGREDVSDSECVMDLTDAISEWLCQWAEAGGVSPTRAGFTVTFTAAPWQPTEGAA